MFVFQPITALYLIGVVISTVLTMIILKRRPAPGAQAFALFNLVAAWWVLTCILEYGAVDIAAKIFLAKLQCISILSSGVLWFIFTQNYTRHSWWRRPRNLALLSLFPLITWGIVLTNEWHGLYWPNIYLIDTQFGQTAIWEHGIWFWASATYQYFLVITGIVFLIKFNRNKSKLHRKQLAVLVLGATAPLVFNVIYLFQIKALEGFDFTPLALSISGILYALLIFRFHFLDVNTIARNSLVEQIPEGILVLNTEGNITDMNRAAENIMGFTKSEVNNLPIGQVWPEFRKIKPSFQPLEHKTISCNFNNCNSYLELSLTPMIDPHGILAGELLILRDVTEQKQAQSALFKSEQKYKQLYEKEKTERSELEKESQARANFISVLTHELKTPLTPLLASIDLLFDKFGNDQISIEGRLIRNAMIGSNSLNNRLNELLDLAKMSSGTYQFDCQPVEAGEYFKAVTGRFVLEFRKNNQLLVTDVEPALTIVKLDTARFERALTYLLHNASKSCDNGDPIILRVRIDDNQLLIDIEDHGESISEDEKQRLFEPYHRVEQDRQKFSGLGLGFAITKHIIDAHGGWIQLQSDQGAGNKFRIGIPLYQTNKATGNGRLAETDCVISKERQG
jgi:PAS domain S-box-containing protein